MQQITSYQFSIFCMLAFILILSSCSDNSIKSEEDPSLKKEKVLEKAEILFPDELVTLYEERIETQSIDLDSLQAEIDGLIDTLNKYSSVDEFRAAVKKQYDVMSSEMAKRGKSMSKAPCVNNFGLGFARSVEVFAGVSKGIGVKIAGQLSTRGGGGSDYIYDFVNMDRAVYTYSFCGVGAGLGIGAGGGLRKNTGFTGLRKWFWNIKPNQQSVKDRFEGSGRSYALGVSTALNKVAGIEVGASVGYVHEVEWWNDSHVVENMAQCPVAFTSKPVHGGVKELTFSASFASSVGPSVEAVALFDGEIAGTHRTYVEDSYNDYRSITGRIGSSIKMAKELILPDPSELITTGGPAPLAAATVVILGAFNPSDCPPPDQVPNVETDEVAEVEMTTSLVRGSILEDGGQPITEMGVCWDKNQNPTLENNCLQLDGKLSDFEVSITGLTPDTKYYVRAFATNSIGTAYGNQVDFKTKSDFDGPKFFFAENGVTVKCPNANPGESGTIEGKEYIAVSNDLDYESRPQGPDRHSKYCTSLYTDMSHFFQDPGGGFESNINGNISHWDVSNVKKMNNMFDGEDFNQDLSFWDVSNVEEMGSMFSGSSFNQDIGNWDVSSVTNMDYMFWWATDFDQDISEWCVEKIQEEPEMFSGGGPLRNSHKPKWGTCPNN